MNSISGIYLLNLSRLQTVFSRCFPFIQQECVGKRSQFCSVQHKLLFGCSRRLYHLSRPPANMTNNLNKSFLSQETPFFNSSVTWQDQRRGIVADTKTTAVTIWEDLKQIRFSPVPALVLGFSGLIPFAAAPAYMVFTQAFSSQLVFAQTAYGACILSFLGGVRWGFVIPEESQCLGDWVNFGYSVTPSLVAWMALMLPQPMSILLVMTGIAGSAYFDTTVKGYPSWFKGLRFTLSFGAILALWTAFLCQYMLDAPADKQEALKEGEN